MPRPDSHRDSTLERRRALLEAAVELVAERGVSGVTHREVAKRAGVPLSTTSYFFGSIDELVLEAMHVFQTELLTRLEHLEGLLAEQRLTPVEAADGLVEILLAESSARIVAQFESYLEATRRPDQQQVVGAVIAAFERAAEAALAAAGARRPREGARALVALIDGFALHRVAWPRPRTDREALRQAVLDMFLVQTLDERDYDRLSGRLSERLDERPQAVTSTTPAAS